MQRYFCDKRRSLVDRQAKHNFYEIPVHLIIISLLWRTVSGVLISFLVILFRSNPEKRVCVMMCDGVLLFVGPASYRTRFHAPTSPSIASPHDDVTVSIVVRFTCSRGSLQTDSGHNQLQ